MGYSGNVVDNSLLAQSIDLGTLLTRLTGARATNLDNLAAAPALAATALSIVQWTAGRAGNLDNLAILPSPASTALSNVQYTATRAGYLDNLVAAPALASLWTATRAGYIDNLAGGIAAAGTLAEVFDGSLVEANGAYSAWSQIVAASARAVKFLCLNAQPANSTVNDHYVELGIGAAASEVVIGRLRMRTSGTTNGGSADLPLIIAIPTSTRFSIRAKGTGGTDTMHYSLTLIG